VPIMHRDVPDQAVPQPLRPINWIFFRVSFFTSCAIRMLGNRVHIR